MTTIENEEPKWYRGINWPISILRWVIMFIPLLVIGIGLHLILSLVLPFVIVAWAMHMQADWQEEYFDCYGEVWNWLKERAKPTRK